MSEFFSSLSTLWGAYHWKLDDKEKAAVKKLIDGFASDGSSGTPAVPAFPAAPPMLKSPDEMTEAELHTELNRQIAGEKRRVDGESASGSGNSETATG